jgi:hypothetical protein
MQKGPSPRTQRFLQKGLIAGSCRSPSNFLQKRLERCDFYTPCYTTTMFFWLALVVVFAQVAQSITVSCDAAAMFTESRSLFTVTSNASSFDSAFALAMHKHCWPATSADGEVAADTWESRVDEHLYELQDRLHQLNQLLQEQWVSTDEAAVEEGEAHEEEEPEEPEMEAGKIVQE